MSWIVRAALMASVDDKNLAYSNDRGRTWTKYSGIDLMEYALNLNLARDFGQIMSFCEGDLNSQIGDIPGRVLALPIRNHNQRERRRAVR